ncbi:hypothetical protein [Gandjariella thermophila]|uniref:hypothetical protein n=1 Tax=Gandjariella thermophila TaxID=1931992 RepID=UPI0010F475DA|nr:hypothetical protein [Gandjariella thermophila]
MTAEPGGWSAVDDLPEHLSGTLPVRVPGPVPPRPDDPHVSPGRHVMERVLTGLQNLPDD